MFLGAAALTPIPELERRRKAGLWVILIPMATRAVVRVVAATLLVASCGEESDLRTGVNAAPTTTQPAAPTVPGLKNPDATSVVMTEAEAACVDFYRSAATPTIEEATYMRVLADRIAESGHLAAAVVLADLADQWEVGVWEGEQDEVWQSGLWATAGRLLGDAGELRCADLAESWGIDGYEGEPDPFEMLNRQRLIWDANGLSSYYLLAAGRTKNEERFTQIQVKVTDGQIDEIRAVEITSLQPSDLPQTIDAYDDRILALDVEAGFFNLVHAYPRRALVSDGTEYVVRLDITGYPNALEYFDTVGGVGEKG